jgi:pseudoazurin
LQDARGGGHHGFWGESIEFLKEDTMNFRTATTALALVSLLGSPTIAGEFTVKMISVDSEGRAMQFEPAFLKIAPGDTVTFAASESHDSDSLADGIPEGGDGWRGNIDEELTVTLTVEGFYAFKCTPHFFDGMVGLIQVGDEPENAAAIAALEMSAKARGRMDELLAAATTGDRR